MRIDVVQTTGGFRLEDVEAEVTNNIWLLGDDDEVIVVDAAHDAAAIVAAVAGRRVGQIICTHGHNDHVNAAVELAQAVDAPVALHPADRMLWEAVHPGRAPDVDLAEADVLEVAGARLKVLHTPGHSPGSVCLHHAEGEVVFGGDTLFNGGPAPPRSATGTSRRSSPRSATAFWCCPTPPPSTRATAKTPSSATRRPTSRSGSTATTEVVDGPLTGAGSRPR